MVLVVGVAGSALGADGTVTVSAENRGRHAWRPAQADRGVSAINPPTRCPLAVPPPVERAPRDGSDDGLGCVYRRKKGKSRAGCGGTRLGGRVGRPHAPAAGTLRRAGDCSLAGSSTSSAAETCGCASSCARASCATFSSARGESCQTQTRLVVWRRPEWQQAIPDGLALREEPKVLQVW